MIVRCKHRKNAPGDGGITDGCGWQGPGDEVTMCPQCGSTLLKRVIGDAEQAERLAMALQWHASLERCAELLGLPIGASLAEDVPAAVARMLVVTDAAEALVDEAVGPGDPPRRGSNLERLWVALHCRPGAPVERVRLRPVVLWFAEQMERALRENDHKGGWHELPPLSLAGEATSHGDEMFATLCVEDENEASVPHDPKRVITEAVASASFTMMVADHFRDGGPSRDQGLTT
jgi:hypothetical protein